MVGFCCNYWLCVCWPGVVVFVDVFAAGSFLMKKVMVFSVAMNAVAAVVHVSIGVSSRVFHFVVRLALFTG